MAERVAIALGSNLGDREGSLRFARDAIGRLETTKVVAATAVEETAPLGPPGQPAYLNPMLLVEPGLEPRDLLDALLAIENKAGRVRRERWGPRTLDCDIVRWGTRTISEPGLTIPHPEIANRDFWQRELQDLDARTTGA